MGRGGEGGWLKESEGKRVGVGGRRERGVERVVLLFVAGEECAYDTKSTALCVVLEYDTNPEWRILLNTLYVFASGTKSRK